LQDQLIVGQFGQDDFVVGHNGHSFCWLSVGTVMRRLGAGNFFNTDMA
jgi:hypothetical protein